MTGRRKAPTGSSKHLLFSWHRLRITLYLLLTINRPYSPQLVLTFHLTRSHHHCLFEGRAKSKSYRLTAICWSPCKSSVATHLVRHSGWSNGLLPPTGDVWSTEVTCPAPHIKSGRLTTGTPLGASYLAKKEFALCASNHQNKPK